MFLSAIPVCMTIKVTAQCLLVLDIVIGTYKFYLVWYSQPDIEELAKNYTAGAM